MAKITETTDEKTGITTLKRRYSTTVFAPFKVDVPYRFDKRLIAEISEGTIVGFSALADFCGATPDDIERAIKFLQKVIDVMRENK